MWRRRLEEGVSPSEFALIVAVVTLFSGTCLIQSCIALVMSVISKSLYVETRDRLSPCPSWTPGWREWLFDVGSLVAALLVAIALATWTYRRGVAYAKQRATEPREQPPVQQFTLKSLLLLQLYIAVGLGMIAWLGRPIVPLVFGVFGAMAGYCATLASARRRVFDIVVGCLISAVIGATLVMTPHDLPMMPESRLSEGVRGDIVLTILAMLPLVALVGVWKLHLRRPANEENGSGGAEHN
jgi:hypothetical protein